MTTVPKSGTDPITLMAMMGSAQDKKPAGFEGPEKRLEVIVRDGVTGRLAADGLRAVDDSIWADIVGTLNAKIVSKISNESFDSYVLTESSLFVMRDRMILITCGTTTLLEALPKALEVVNERNLEVEWCSFMRKNFSYPWEQVGPHTSMETESDILGKYLPAGQSFVLGPVDSDHYFFFVFDDVRRPAVEDDIQISVTMYDLAPEVAAKFYADSFSETSEITASIRDATGLCSLVDKAHVQDLQFAPCGYSINMIEGSVYQTMHITPEEHCSFASYETNGYGGDIAGRLNAVLAVFRPKRFSVCVIADPGQAETSELQVEEVSGYTVANGTMTEFSEGYVANCVNYIVSGEQQEAAAKQE